MTMRLLPRFRFGLTVVLCLLTGFAVADSETILVMGATGRQGGAVVEDLLSRGYQVRGMTRKPESKKAQRLRDLGVEIVAGNYQEPETMQAAMQGIERAFFYSGFSRNELDEGRNVIDAAKTASISHLVYSTGAAADPERGVPGSVKGQLEVYLIASGVPYTVIRPVAFMENFRGQQKMIAERGFIDSRAPDANVAFITVPDIGFIVGEVFAVPDDWRGRAVTIAADEMTLSELAATFGRVMGRDVEYVRQPLEEYLAGFPRPLRPLFRWYDEVGYEPGLAMRDRYPNLTTLEQYLRATGWENWQPKP